MNMAKKIAKKIEKKVVKTTKPVKKATKKPTVKSVVKKAVKPVKEAPAKKAKKIEEEPYLETGGNGVLSEDFLPEDELESEMMGDDLELPDDEEEEY